MPNKPYLPTFLGVILTFNLPCLSQTRDTNPTITGKDVIDYNPLNEPYLDEAGEFSRQNEVVKAAAFFKRKRYAEALEYYKRAAELTGDDGSARIMMGYCYFYMKQYPAALKQYQTVRDFGKSAEVRERARKLEVHLQQLMSGACPGNCRKGYVLKVIKGKEEIVKCPTCGGTGKVTPRK